MKHNSLDDAKLTPLADKLLSHNLAQVAVAIDCSASKPLSVMQNKSRLCDLKMKVFCLTYRSTLL